jgi:ABC-type sugar transport system ATPase subunit
VIVEMRDVSKRFGAVQALDDVSLAVGAGEIHAVVGENGAGKSTLVRILAGVETADAGVVRLEGEEVRFTTPRQALEAGIATIHQELELIPQLSVAENIFVGERPTRAGVVRHRTMSVRAGELLEKLRVEISPAAVVGDLSIAAQQSVAIARALRRTVRVIIMDEVTSALGEREATGVFELVRGVAARGVAIIYITHKLEEVFGLCGRVTVLRDGKHIQTTPSAATSTEEIVRAMVGRDVDDFYPKESRPSEQTLLEVRDLQRRTEAAPVSFSLNRGEILGFAGLTGSGRSGLARTIVGLDPARAGRIVLDGKELEILSARDAIKAGVAYVPEDRGAQGLWPTRSIQANIGTVRQWLSGKRWHSRREERELAVRVVRQLGVRCASVEQPVGELSGGNQQKVLLGRWLACEPVVLILDEPTRGVDIGAKSEIHRLISGLAEGGAGVILISSDLPELLAMSDRVLVLHRGRVVDDIHVDSATPERVAAAALGEAHQVVAS